MDPEPPPAEVHPLHVGARVSVIAGTYAGEAGAVVTALTVQKARLRLASGTETKGLVMKTSLEAQAARRPGAAAAGAKPALAAAAAAARGSRLPRRRRRRRPSASDGDAAAGTGLLPAAPGPRAAAAGSRIPVFAPGLRRRRPAPPAAAVAADFSVSAPAPSFPRPAGIPRQGDDHAATPVSVQRSAPTLLSAGLPAAAGSGSAAAAREARAAGRAGALAKAGRARLHVVRESGPRALLVRGDARDQRWLVTLAVGETVILLTSPLHRC